MLAQALLKVKLKEKALELGFSDLRVCTVDDFSSEESDKFQAWINCGMNAQMAYLERAVEKKISPKKFFDKAQSAIVVCANFYRPTSETRIATYAQGADYHDILPPKLRELGKILEDAGGEQKYSVDASPLWEKALAVRAGIGWRGKNTLIIREENGAWSFLGVILTSLALPFDEPIENLCADCRKCLDACPSSALGDWGLNANKCISYLTIEKKGELTPEEKNLSKDKIFGCDICLRACPYGANAPLSNIAEFQTSLKLSANPYIEEIKKVAQGTPMSRRFK